MILYGGKIYESSEQNRLLSEAERYINVTLAEKSLPAEKTIAAIDVLGREIASGKYDELLNALHDGGSERYKLLAAAVLSRENLELKLKTELGNSCREYVTNPPAGLPRIKVTTAPLGVIFHIAAGNMDGLPAYSLAEGLLTGNVNILKLPQADNGLSLKIISRLIEIEPALSDYIMVFDTPSSDIQAMRRMAELADGISVWGGTEATRAVRSLAPAGVKLIEWGHKLSFCYISGYADKQSELAALAEHIAVTKQRLCSSCQTIFIDTESEAELHDFCAEFLTILDKAAERHTDGTIGERAYAALIGYTERLEDIIDPKRSSADEHRGRYFRLKVCADSELELSPMTRCVLVKRLPQNDIVPVLRWKKGFLQTAGLICDPTKRGKLSDVFARCGITRITTAGNMSEYFCGEAHDGEYPLRRYTRIVDTEED